MTDEFKRGDKVTFHAFKDEKIPATVLAVYHHGAEPTYRLEGDGKPLVTITSGRSICESKYFIEPGEFVW